MQWENFRQSAWFDTATQASEKRKVTIGARPEPHGCKRQTNAACCICAYDCVVVRFADDAVAMLIGTGVALGLALRIEHNRLRPGRWTGLSREDMHSDQDEKQP